MALLLLLLQTLLLACGLTRGVVLKPKGAELRDLKELTELSRDGVIRLRDDSYKEYAKFPDSPREYYIVVFFDAVMMHNNPSLDLPGFRRDFALVAKQYAESVVGQEDAIPVFFADIEFKQSEKTFQIEEINSLPYVKVFGPGTDSKGATLDFGRFGKTFAGVVNFMKECGIKTENIKPPPPLTRTQMIFLAVTFVVTAPFLASYLFTHRTFLHDPRLWCLWALAIYLFSVSGGMFKIIRNMPWYVPLRDQPGKFMYFLQSSGNQFGVEGLAIGSFYTLFGLITAFNLYVLPRTQSALAKRIVGYASIFACAFVVRQVVELEVWKQGYWVHGFWPSSWR